MHEPDLAIECASEALKIQINMYEAMNYLSIAYLLKGDEEKSDEYYKRSVLNGNPNPEYLRNTLKLLTTGDKKEFYE